MGHASRVGGWHLGCIESGSSYCCDAILRHQKLRFAAAAVSRDEPEEIVASSRNCFKTAKILSSCNSDSSLIPLTN